MKFIFSNTTYIFKPKIIPIIATILGLAILLSLSVWQMKRLSWKKNLIETRIDRYEKNSKELNEFKDLSDSEFYKVNVIGSFINNKEMFMPALSKNGNNGFHILVPLKLLDGKIIIYDTGWVPTHKKEQAKRTENLDDNISIKESVIRLPGRKGKYQPDNELENNFWFFVDTQEMSKYLNLNVEKEFYLEAANDGPEGYPLGGQTRIYIRNNHLQYAITWFLIACTLLGVFLAASIKIEKSN
ncbi:MAG: hypothetical protein CMP37_02500 [Rickettsiales bacterium]|nr:hypothetical protein [Rickettsiales bacterium]OUW71615.1 MAG: hypothetical protein CBD71_02390 [Rickettsiales bacterium TMED211]|tara:strand:+ start:416 stop:1141 length:726 start_codon:yes stop_codon:yes gene_type:complete